MTTDLTSSRGFRPQIVTSLHPRLLISEPSREWIGTVNNRLEELIRLRQGWNGYQAQPVSYENAVFAQKIIEGTCRNNNIQPSIVPGSSGDLQVEWHTLEGDVELHVLAPYTVRAYYSNESNQTEQEVDLTNDFSLIGTWLNEIKETSIAHIAAAA